MITTSSSSGEQIADIEGGRMLCSMKAATGKTYLICLKLYLPLQARTRVPFLRCASFQIMKMGGRHEEIIFRKGDLFPP